MEPCEGVLIVFACTALALALLSLSLLSLLSVISVLTKVITVVTTISTIARCFVARTVMIFSREEGIAGAGD